MGAHEPIASIVRRRAFGVPRTPSGLLVLVVAKLLDAATTAVGLLFVPSLVEANPTLRGLMAAVGVVPGLLLGTVLVVVAVAVVTEAGVATCVRRGVDAGVAGATIRTVGYGPLSFVYVAASLHNLRLVALTLLA